MYSPKLYQGNQRRNMMFVVDVTATPPLRERHKFRRQRIALFLKVGLAYSKQILMPYFKNNIVSKAEVFFINNSRS